MAGLDLFQVVGFGLVAALILVVLRQHRPEVALGLSLAVGAIIFLFLAGRLSSVIGVLGQVARRSQVSLAYLGTVLRVIGVAYLTEFGAQVCRDAGEGAVAAKVELAGKVAILLLAAPVVVAVLDLILRLLA
ncbi:MAG: stage III sporulation protein AD [Acetobacteraceae bacterium]|nr:stage III sporulation protein AD [Acetobacteraceae bacterium]